MKQHLTFTIILFFGLSTYGQQYEIYDLDFKSKFDTKSFVRIFVTYSDTSKIPEKEIFIEKISNPTRKLLKKYSTTEVYWDKKNEVDSILKITIIDIFKKSEYDIKNTNIVHVDISEETIKLHQQFLQLEQNYLEVELQIYYRINAIEEELKTNKKLTRIEKKELKKELFVLNNAKYIQVLYDKKMKLIDIKQN